MAEETWEEKAKRMRREQRQVMRERQKSDPKYQALKEQQKAARKQWQQKVMQGRKSEPHQDAELSEDDVRKREIKDQELKGLLMKGSDLIVTNNDVSMKD